MRFLFDMRGFWPDERVDGGAWLLENPLYRAIYHHFKRLERELLAGADHIISLTEAGHVQLAGRDVFARREAPITVIPCCVDFSHFPLIDAARREAARTELGIAPDARVLSYLGSCGSWYLRDEMLDAFRVYRSRYPGARFLFVTPDRPEDILAAAQARGIAPDDLPRLGTPFTQADAGYERRYEGTGLGLSVVKGLANLHGGDMRIDSILGGGTTVTVALPLKPDATAGMAPRRNGEMKEFKRAG